MPNTINIGITDKYRHMTYGVLLVIKSKTELNNNAQKFMFMIKSSPNIVIKLYSVVIAYIIRTIIVISDANIESITTA